MKKGKPQAIKADAQGAEAKSRLGGALPHQQRASESLQWLSVLCSTNYRNESCKQCRAKLRLIDHFNEQHMLDVILITEQAIRTLIHHAGHFGNAQAVKYLAYRANLAAYKPQNCFQSVEELIKSHSTKNVKLWNSTLKKRKGRNSARSPQFIWIKRLLERAMLWRSCLQRTPKDAHHISWRWCVEKQLGFSHSVPFPKTFVRDASADCFVDEVVMPMLRLLEKCNHKQWEALGFKTRRLKTGPNWQKIRSEALKTVKRISERMWK